MATIVGQFMRKAANVKRRIMAHDTWLRLPLSSRTARDQIEGNQQDLSTKKCVINRMQQMPQMIARVNGGIDCLQATS